jgi:hypothetical protein
MGKEAVHAALDLITAEELNHYDAPCPHCGKTNHVSPTELQRAAPDWEAKSDSAETK